MTANSNVTAPPDKTIEAVVGEPVAWRVQWRGLPPQFTEAPLDADTRAKLSTRDCTCVPLYRHPAPALTAGDSELLRQMVAKTECGAVTVMVGRERLARLCALVRRLAPGVTG